MIEKAYNYLTFISCARTHMFDIHQESTYIMNIVIKMLGRNQKSNYLCMTTIEIKNMRSRTANWYETTVRYEKTMEDGMQKKISELYVVDAVSFGDAEQSIASEMSAYVSGELEIKNINPAAYGEIFFSENGNDDRWYKTKLQFITLDEKSGKEKRSNVNYLVQAANMNGAIKNIDTVMGGTMIDYVIANISETRIMDVYEHNAPKKQERDDKPEYEEEK